MSDDEREAYESAFKDMASNLGLEAYDYSGRGMYGSTCLAVNTNGYVDTEEIKAEWREQLSEGGFDHVGLHLDQMGLGSVLYLRRFAR